MNEPSVIHYTVDGSAPTFASPKWERQGLRRPGEVFEFTETTTVRWLAHDLAANTSTGQATFVVDNQAPTTTASFSPAEQGGFYRNPTITLTAVDNGDAGIEKTEYSLDGGPLTLYTGPFQVTGDGDHTLSFFSTDRRRERGGAELGRRSRWTAPKPAITITKPANGASYLLGSVQNADYSCSDALSGVASCVGHRAERDSRSTRARSATRRSPSTRATTPATRRRSRCSTTSTGRSPASSGLSMTRLNTEKAGKDVEIRFKLGGFRGWDVIAAGYPQSERISCSSISSQRAFAKAVRRVLDRDDDDDDDDRGNRWRKNRALDYDRGVYEYEWETSRSWDNTCRVFVLKLADNTIHTASFRFR